VAYTTPRTWVTGEVVTAAMLNANVRDNMKAVGDPWIADVRTSSTIWTAATTNPTLGNGTLVSRYRIVGVPGSGGTLDWELTITGGSTTTWGSGQFFFAYPGGVSPKTASWYIPVEINDASAGSFLGVGVVTGGSVNIRCITSAAGALSSVTASVPMTWANGDVLGFHLTCEIA
jgi:hypothetical protein